MQPEIKVQEIPIELLVPNRYQPRKQFDETKLQELSDSIKEYGIISPIIVRQIDNKYEIIAGERRYRAAKKNNLKTVPVIVRTIEENKMAELALIENLQREELNPIEEAKSYEEIMKLSNITQDELGKKIGKSQSSIANKLRLLSLPEQIQQALNEKRISERHARSLLTVTDQQKQIELLNRIIQDKLTVKELDNVINEKKLNEEELKTAINDIMKNLQLTNEKQKEEEESDNMNNGSFFPNNNMDPNMSSLNSMNMQSMNMNSNQVTMPDLNQFQQPVQNDPAMQQNMNNQFNMPNTMNTDMTQMQGFGQGNMLNNSMATPAPDGQFMNQFQQPTTVENILPQEQMNNQINSPTSMNYDMNIMDNAPVQGYNQQMENNNPPIMDQPQESMVPMMDQPLFATSFDQQPQPTMENNSQQVNTVGEPQQVQSFEFNVQPNMQTAPEIQSNDIYNPMMTQSQQSVDQPITFDQQAGIEPMQPAGDTTGDKLTTTLNILDSNGIQYKKYSNETGTCIIIEI